jgi:hypothetical protein
MAESFINKNLADKRKVFSYTLLHLEPQPTDFCSLGWPVTNKRFANG